MKHFILFSLVFSVGTFTSVEQLAVVASTAGQKDADGIVVGAPQMMKPFDVAALQKEWRKGRSCWERFNAARGLEGKKIRGNYHHDESCIKEAGTECRSCCQFAGDCAKQASCDGIACCCCPIMFCAAELAVCYCRKYVVQQQSV